MDNNKDFGFLGGLLLGGIIGAAVALLMAPASGKQTLEQIRSEGMALKERGEEFGENALHQTEKMMKQGQKSVADGQKRTVVALEEQRKNLREAIDAGKHAASERKDEVLNRA